MSQMISLDKISPNPAQPRRDFNSETLYGLAQTIQAGGVIQPIVVHQGRNGAGLILHDGERRWRSSIAIALAGEQSIPLQTACQIVSQAEMETFVSQHRALLARQRIPYVITTNGNGNPSAPSAVLSRSELLRRAVIANVQRDDLNPIELAEALKKIQEADGLNNAQLARQTGLTYAKVRDTLRLLDLDEELHDLVAIKKLPRERKAVDALLNIPDAKARVMLAKRLAEKKATARAVQAAAERLSEQLGAEKKPPKRQPKIKVDQKLVAKLVAYFIVLLKKDARLLEDCAMLLLEIQKLSREEDDETLATLERAEAKANEAMARVAGIERMRSDVIGGNNAG